MLSPILKSNLLVNLSIKMCGLEVLLFSEFINIVSIAYIWMDLIKLLYTSLGLTLFLFVVIFYYPVLIDHKFTLDLQNQ